MMQELDAAQGKPRTEEIGKWVRELAGRILKKDFKLIIIKGHCLIADPNPRYLIPVEV